MKGIVMNMSLHTSSSCSTGIQKRELTAITLISGKEWKPSEKEFLQWSTSYPDIDLPGELRRMEDWFQKHPDRRKTERGMRTFVKVWLDCKVHGGAVSRCSMKRGKYQNAFNDFSSQHEYDFEELEAELLRISAEEVRMNSNKLWTTVVQSEN